MKEKVTSLKWSLALVEAGIEVGTFSWFENHRGEYFISDDIDDEIEHSEICPAPLCVELLSLLPDGAGLEKVGRQFFAWAKEDEYSYKEIPADNPRDALAQLAIFLKNEGLLEGEG